MKISKCFILHLFVFITKATLPYFSGIVLEKTFWTFLGVKNSFFLTFPLKMEYFSTPPQHTSQYFGQESRRSGKFLGNTIKHSIVSIHFTTPPTKHAPKAILSGITKGKFAVKLMKIKLQGPSFARTSPKALGGLHKFVHMDIYFWQFAVVRFFCPHSLKWSLRWNML